ncbi:MAG: helix-turn-helix transcriptional regulator [Pseudomonadota bacterium]
MPNHPIDVYVGRRVRIRRMEMGITQQQLAREIGVTFQQVQKYERGVNRISASKLFRVARLFGVAVDFFFEGAEDTEIHIAHEPGFEESSEAFRHEELEPVLAFLSSHEGMELNRSFKKIPSTKLRREIASLIEAIADAEDDVWTEEQD